jgi:hypothetical protein
MAPAGDSAGPSKTKSREPKHNAVVCAVCSSAWGIRTLVWRRDTRSAPTRRANCRGLIPLTIIFGMICASGLDVGLRDTEIILVSAPRGCPTSSSGKCSICPQGLVVEDTSFGRERERVPSLCAWMRAVGARLVGEVCVLFDHVFRCVHSPPFVVLASPFIVQGGPVYKD